MSWTLSSEFFRPGVSSNLTLIHRSGTVLPAVLFPVLSILGAKHIFPNISNSTLLSELGSSCAPGTLLAQKYTGYGPLDGTLCGLVAFFQAALEPESEPYTTWLLASLAPIGLFTFVESARIGRTRMLSSPVVTIMGIAYQRLTGGVVLPLYWALFILTRSHLRQGMVDQRYARALVIAAFAGYILPSIMMVSQRTPGWIALWQGFPVLLFVVERAALFLQPSGSSAQKSGTNIVRAMYTAIAVIAAAIHLKLVLPSIDSPATLKHAFLPHVVGPTFWTTSAANASLNFLQWDGVFIAGAAQLASLWFGRSMKEVITLAICQVLGGALLGPGAVLALVYAWREGIVGA
jgi:hypothetical protein